ncbi:facilitated trehalose transporter Tret1-like [Agrilus planipennis]|uniref:Facilitated trehalose transporter Tret1-like n=1 Tax=Agrilus planipennis TaxID=224129 RepID=A0A7F5R5R8_AGRPL|nr:facilitated trehalose transporter Tret1-like [Agrilus planipennis]
MFTMYKIFFRWKKDVDEEFIKLESDVKRQISEKGTLRDLFVKSVNRRALIVGCGLRAAQQFSGMPAFGVYTQYMFEQSGSVFSKSTSSIIYTGALLLIMSSNMFLMDRYGRRLSMMLSSIGCGLTLLVLAAFCYVADNELVDVSSVRWIPLLGMVIWLLFAGSGLGLVPILMLGELFSASVKGKAINVVCIFFAASFLTSTKVFQTLANNFGLFAPFTFFGLCCVVILIFSYTCVPETKGKTLEEIQQMLRRTK